jgi:hypothetical protein
MEHGAKDAAFPAGGGAVRSKSGRGGAAASRASFHFVARHMREADRAMPNSLDDPLNSAARPDGPSPTKRPRYTRYAQARLSVQAPPIADPTPPPAFRVRRMQPPAPVSSARVDPITTPVFTTPRVQPQLGADQVKANRTEIGTVCRRISLGDGTPLQQSPSGSSDGLGCSHAIVESNIQGSASERKDFVQTSTEESPGIFTQQRPLTLVTCAYDEYPICAQSLPARSAAGSFAVDGVFGTSPPISGTQQVVQGREANSHQSCSMAQCRSPETGDEMLRLDACGSGNELLAVVMSDALHSMQARQRSNPCSGPILIEPEEEFVADGSGSCKDVLLLDTPVAVDATRPCIHQECSGESSSIFGLYSNQPALTLETMSPMNNGSSQALPVQSSPGPCDMPLVTDNLPIGNEMLYATSQVAAVVGRQCLSESSYARGTPSGPVARHRTSDCSQPVPNPSSTVKLPSVLSNSQQGRDKSKKIAGNVPAGNCCTPNIPRIPIFQTRSGGRQFLHESLNALQVHLHPGAHDIDNSQKRMPGAIEISCRKYPAVRCMLPPKDANIRDVDTGNLWLNPVNPCVRQNSALLHQSCVGNMNAATISPPPSSQQQIRAKSPAGFEIWGISSSNESFREISGSESHVDVQFADHEADDVQGEITISSPFQSEQKSSQTMSNDERMLNTVAANIHSSPSASDELGGVNKRTIPARSLFQGYDYFAPGVCADGSLLPTKELCSSGPLRRPEHGSSSSTDPPPDDDDEDMNLWRRRMAQGTKQSNDSEDSSEEQGAIVSRSVVFITAGLDIAVSDDDDSSSISEQMPLVARTGLEENINREPIDPVQASSARTVSVSFGTAVGRKSRKAAMADGLKTELSNDKYNSTPS